MARGARERKAVVKVVNSAANFTNIGGIEDAALIPMGIFSPAFEWKPCTCEVALEGPDRGVVLQDASVNMDDWQAAALTFPLACHEQFIERER